MRKQTKKRISYNPRYKILYKKKDNSQDDKGILESQLCSKPIKNPSR